MSDTLNRRTVKQTVDLIMMAAEMRADAVLLDDIIRDERNSREKRANARRVRRECLKLALDIEAQLR